MNPLSVLGSPITRYIMLGLLVATLVLGGLLKRSYTHNGELQDHLNTVVQQLKDTQDGWNKAVASSAIDEAICTTDAEQKQANDRHFSKLQEKLAQQADKPNDKTKGLNEQQFDAITVSVFNDAECQAGADCSTSSAASGL